MMRMTSSRAALFAVIASPIVLGLSPAWAEPETTSVSPYIDQLKAKMEQEGKPSTEPVRTAENPDPYIQSIREKMRESGKEAQAPQGTQPYIDQLKEKNPSLNEPSGAVGYTERERAKLAPEEPGGAIQAVKEGRSKLTMKRPGHISAGVGFKMAASMSHSFSADPSMTANSFQTIYGNGWVPDLSLIGEYKPFYSETFGSLGLVGSAGVSIFKANARFGQQLYQPDGTTPFPMTSRTKLTFLSVPVMVGAKYQFNFSHIIRPYAVAGPTLIGISENRNDGVGAKTALSKGVTTTVGTAFLLDWISGNNTWNLYQDFGVKHYYLTLEYTKLTTISSQVDISYSGLSAGFVFDF